MSFADAALFRDLAARVERLEALLGLETTEGGPGVPAQPLAIDAQLARVIAVLADGASIRAAAHTLGIDRNRVARLRARALREGLLVSPPRGDPSGPA
jgi:hypothetical protein